MAKDKSAAAVSAKAQRKAERKAAKKERKAENLAKKGGVSKSSTKKEGKKEKEKKKVLAERALNEIVERKGEEDEDEEIEEGEEGEAEEEETNGAADEMEEEEDEDEDEGVATKTANSSKKSGKADVKGMGEDKEKLLASRPVGALVPFANPLADDKVAKKVFKAVKKAATHRTLKRGVKEVVKALRKSAPATTTTTLPPGIVVLAADISPMDVISHIPVLAEDHNIPYIYVTSRAELGMAGMTKRPTSVVMVSRDLGAKKKDGDTAGQDDKESWEESFRGLVKVVEREGRHVKV